MESSFLVLDDFVFYTHQQVSVLKCLLTEKYFIPLHISLTSSAAVDF